MLHYYIHYLFIWVRLMGGRIFMNPSAVKIKNPLLNIHIQCGTYSKYSTDATDLFVILKRNLVIIYMVHENARLHKAIILISAQLISIFFSFIIFFYLKYCGKIFLLWVNHVSISLHLFLDWNETHKMWH